MSRQVVYYVAATVDHYIAHEDGTFTGFLAERQHIPDYLESLRDYDTVLMGKHTYEVGYLYGVKPGEPSPTYPHMMQYVFSQSMEQYQHPQLQVIRDDPAVFVRNLKVQAGKSIYLCGGGKLAGYLLQNQGIDRLILKVNPVIFGKGISLFGEFDAKRGINLDLLDTKIYQNGVIFLHYAVQYP